MNFTLRIATFNYRPFQWYNRTGLGAPVGGYNGEILRALTTSMGVNYEIFEAHSWGLLHNGSWTGGLGMVARDEADMTLYPTNPTAGKMDIAEHTPTVNPIQLVAMQGRMSKFSKNSFGLVMTFEIEVWIAIMVTLLVTCVAMVLAHQLLTYDEEHPKSKSFLINKYFFMLFSHIWCEGEDHPPPDRASIRLMWITWYLMISTILMNAFAGQMKAAMMVKPENERIDTLRQLADNDRVKFYMLVDSATYFVFKNASQPHFRVLFQRAITHNTVVYPKVIFSRKVYREVLQTRACVVASSQAASSLANAMCSTMKRGEFYISREVPVGFQAVFHMNLRLADEIRRSIVLRIFWMRDSGLLAKWWAEAAGHWNGCQGSEMHQVLQALNIDDFEGMGALMLIGNLISILIFVGEYLSYSRLPKTRVRLLEK